MSKDSLLNDALGIVNRYLELRPDDADAKAVHDELLTARTLELNAAGVLDGVGGKPIGSSPGITLTPGPPISDYIIEERDRLRDA